MNGFDERVTLVNDILKKLDHKLRVENVNEINSHLFILLYRLLFKVVPEGMDENDPSKEVSNIRILLKSLSRDILHVSLNHIDPEKVVNSVPGSVMNVLEIFQGLVDCMHRRKDLRSDNIGNGDSKRLRNIITDTNMQVDNLTMIAQQRFGQQSERERYLQGKIEELLGRFGGLGGCGMLKKDDHCPLIEYVNDDRDRVVLMRDRCGQDLPGCKVVHGAKGRPFCDEDLTAVTEPCIEDSDLSHGSKDTYIVTGRPSSAEERRVDMTEDGRVKDAWAQVSKDLLQDGYENEFLEMLLREEEALGHRERRDDDRSTLSAFEDGPGRRRPARRGSVRSSSRTVGLVRPIVRHIGGQRSQRTDRGSATSRSSRSGPTTSERDRVDDDNDDLMTRLLRQFPGLTVSEQTLRQLWSQAARQAANIQRVQRDFVSRIGPDEQRVEDARRRQQLLFSLLRKEALHQARLRETQEDRQTRVSARAIKDRQRQQTAKARRYYDEFSQRQRARMLQKQAKEEQVFRTMFSAALKLQRDRINDLRRYAKDKKTESFSQHRKDLDSLENYYKDRFSMLAECLRTERRLVDEQDKSKERALERHKTEVRAKLERDIRSLHDAMVRSDHELYFRQLDAGTALSSAAIVDATVGHKQY